MSSCPNCHQPVAPTDDICENCGAVLSTLMPMPAFVAASSPLAAAISSAGQTQGPVPTISVPGVCPNCGQALHPGDDICEQCGMVISGVGAAVSSTSGSISTNTTLPQMGQSKEKMCALVAVRDAKLASGFVGVVGQIIWG